MEFELDTQRAIDAISEVFGIDPDQPDEWRLDRFGADLGDSIAALADIVFAPRRDALHTPEELIIDVHAILDLHSFPLVICLWEPGADNAFIGSGVEDARELVGDVLCSGPGVVIEALESLLEVVANAYASARGQGRTTTRTAARPALRPQSLAGAAGGEWRRWSHPRVASSASGGSGRVAVLSLAG
jgi:hypothetical protein